MHEAETVVERALPTQTIVARGRHQIPRYSTVVDLQRVHVVIARLLDEGKQAGDRRRLRHFLSSDLAHARAGGGKVGHAAQAQVVREPFERRVRQRTAALVLQCLGKQRKLLVHQLVQQRVRFRGDADRDVIALRHERCRDQVRHGLPDARSRLYDQILRRTERRTHAFGHGGLLRALFVAVIQTSHKPVGRERRSHFLGGRDGEGAFRVGLYRQGVGFATDRLLVGRPRTAQRTDAETGGQFFRRFRLFEQDVF